MSSRAQLKVLRQILVSKVTIGAYAIVGGVMTLAYSGILPDSALVVGIPALVATQLIDTFLYNTFRFEIGTAVWGLIAVFVYLQSMSIGLLYWWFQSRT